MPSLEDSFNSPNPDVNFYSSKTDQQQSTPKNLKSSGEEPRKTQQEPDESHKVTTGEQKDESTMLELRQAVQADEVDDISDSHARTRESSTNKSAETEQEDIRTTSSPFDTRLSTVAPMEELPPSLQEGSFPIEFEATKNGDMSEVRGDSDTIPPPPPDMPESASKSRSTKRTAPLERKINEQIDTMRLKSTSQTIHNAIEAARETTPDATLELHTLGGSLNEVTKLDTVFYIDAKFVINEQPRVMINLGDIRGALGKKFRDVVGSIHSNPMLTPHDKQQQQAEVAAIFTETMKMVQGEVGKRRINERDLDRILGMMSDKISSEPSSTSLKALTLKACLKAIAATDPRIQLDKVPRHFDKNEVLSALRIELERANPQPIVDNEVSSSLDEAEQPEAGEDITTQAEPLKEDSKEKSPILKAIERVKQEGNKINQNTLEEILSEYLDKNTASHLMENLTPLVLSTEVILYNDNRKEVKDQLELLVQKLSDTGPENTFRQEIEVHSYAYKTGVDNIREVLGVQKLLPTLGLETYMLSKTEQPIAGAQIGKSVDPDGLASRWIPGEQFPVDVRKDWADVDLRMRQAIIQGNVTAELKSEWEQKREAMMNVGGVKSLAEHSVIDILFGAGDSHWDQYKKTEEGEFGNFDWARFLAPFPAYQRKGQIFLTLRIGTLDHPIVTEPMTGEPPLSETTAMLSSLYDKILSWDADAIVQQWQEEGLIESSEYFEEKAKELKDIEAIVIDINADRYNDNDLYDLCMKHAVAIPDKASHAEVALALRNELIRKYDSIKKEVFHKVDPKGVEQFKIRLQRMQEYLINADTPTLEGAFEACYEEFAVFYKVLKRIEAEPGQALTYQKLSIKEKGEQANAIRRLRTSSSTGQTRNISPNLQKKLKRASMTAKRKYSGVAQGRKGMDRIYDGEFIDQKHRYGGEILSFWKVWEQSGTDLGFTEWMEKLDAGEKVAGSDILMKKGLIDSEGKPKEMRQVTYMSPEQRVQCRAHVENNIFSTSAEGVLHTDDIKSRPHIFVMDSHRIFIAPYEQGKINHSSFLQGAPVVAAGRMEFKEGRLVAIANHSGHYKPEKMEMLKLLRQLTKMGVDLSEVTVQLVGSSGEKILANKALEDLEKWAQSKDQVKASGFRPLESILVQAETTPNIASKEEIEQMRQALESIRKVAPPSWMARTSYNGLK